MSRFVIVDPFRGVDPADGWRTQLSRREVEFYLHRLAHQLGSIQYATLALNHFTCGRYDQTNAALAKLGIVFYRVGGAVEKRRGASGYQIRKLPNRPGERSEHSMGSYWEPGQTKPKPTENPRFIRTPQGTFPLNDAARKIHDPKPRKPWWWFW